MKNKDYNFKKGIALFYALIIISIVMAVSLAVFSLISGGLPLAEIIKNSQKAFFAADAGAECVLYWDIKEDAFDSSNPKDITCAESTFTNQGENPFNFTLNLSSDACVDISVVKPLSGPIKTEITSAGHSPCQAGAKNRVERTLEISY